MKPLGYLIMEQFQMSFKKIMINNLSKIVINLLNNMHQLILNV